MPKVKESEKTTTVGELLARLVALEAKVKEQEHAIRSLSLQDGVDSYYGDKTGLFQRALDHMVATDPHGPGSYACMVCRQRYPKDIVCTKCVPERDRVMTPMMRSDPNDAE